jgi:ubiquinone/menaquinone biosynthesis C-methylase UbiE
VTENRELFDEWPQKYDQWFTTPVGRLIRKYESELIQDFLNPGPGEKILDAGCGTGVFTTDILSAGTRVVGLDLSWPMLCRAEEKARGYPFHAALGDLMSLPFKKCSFDKVLSMTALEFVQKPVEAVGELFRVTRRGGIVVVATLNRLSPWAESRMEEGKRGHPIFSKAIFRSPDQLRSLAPVKGLVRTAVHFKKEDDPNRAIEIENQGRINGWDTGAFVAARWQKP